MSGRFLLSPLAQADLDNIWTDTARRWGIDQADNYVREIGHHIQTIAEHPLLGRACSEIRENYFKYPSGSHVLFYRRIDDGVDVVRILHERMDFKRHL